MAPRRKSPEADLQKAVCDLLASYERMGRLFFYAVPNDLFNQRSAQARNRIAALKARGLRPGFPDLVVVVKGALGADAFSMYWELKVKGNTLQDNQKQWRERLESFGLDYAIIRSVDDANTILADLF